MSSSPTVGSVSDSWASIDLWLAENAPDLLETFGEGADAQAIGAAEQALGIQFPADFKKSVEIRDGQSDITIGFVEASEFLSLERILDEWKDCASEPTGPIKSDWWNPKWIPFTYDGSGNHLCLDLDPASGAEVGQVITMWHDDAERKVVAPSFQTWLHQVANSLQTGDLVFSDEYNGIVSKED
jgi:cell wall assembly regulator SMI1